MYLRITKNVPREGLVEGSVAMFMNIEEARTHVAAGVAVEVERKRDPKTGEVIENQFVDVPAAADKE